MRRPYYVYIGLQDNGSWGGPSATRSRGGIMNSDWFGIGGGDGFQTAVDPTDYNIVYHRVAGRQHEPLRPAHRPRAEHPAARRGGSGRRRTRGGGGGGGGGARRPRQRWPPNVLERRPRPIDVPLQLEHAVPCSRRTIRASSGSAATGCSSRTTAATRGSASADLTKQIDRNTVAVMGVPGNRTHAVEERRRRRLQHDHRRCRSRRSCPASCGPAPTTATCR